MRARELFTIPQQRGRVISLITVDVTPDVSVDVDLDIALQSGLCGLVYVISSSGHE